MYKDIIVSDVDFKFLSDETTIKTLTTVNRTVKCTSSVKTFLSFVRVDLKKADLYRRNLLQNKTVTSNSDLKSTELETVATTSIALIFQ